MKGVLASNLTKTKRKLTGLIACSHNCYESLDIEMVSKPMKILGIYFTYNLRLKNELNFDVTLKSLKKALKNWQWRNFTDPGKIHLRYQNCCSELPC